MHQFSFPIFDFQALKPLKLVHSDVWGPAPVISTNDFQYYILFVDEYSKFTWLYLLKHKSNVLDIFKFFKAIVEKQLDSKIKVLRTDNGGEFTSNSFKHFYSTHGLIHQLSCPHTPKQNGVVERKHRHIVKCAFTMLSHCQLPPSYWSYAISTTVHIINRPPTPILKNSTPWEVLFQSKPDITHLRFFGCVCFPLLRSYNTHKLMPHTTPCIFLGYIYQDPVTSRVYISRHVHFNETEFFTPQSLTISPTIAPSPTTAPTAQSSTPLMPTQSLIPFPCASSDSQPAFLHATTSKTSSNQSLSLPISIPQSDHTQLPILSPQPSPSPSPSTSPSLSSLAPTLPTSPTIVIPTAISSAAPQVPSIVNTYPMITRSKDGISSPKPLLPRL